jgi:hypothetical protein
MRRIKAFVFFMFTVQSLYSQTFSVSGYVKDINTGESIIGAYVIDSLSKNVVQTNNYGFYLIKDLKNSVSLQATYTGLKSNLISFSLTHDTIVEIKMKSVVELGEVMILSSDSHQNVNSRLGLTTIPLKQLTSTPALGEPDLLKSIQSQPGIKGGVEGSAGIFVRGGSLGENLFLLDDVPMYNVSHLYGFLSVFNSSIVKDIKIMKGSFPARYGGRTSSVIDVRSRDGSNQSVNKEVSLGFISSKFTVEGPLFNDKSTFLLSGRRSYFDLYSGILKKISLLDKGFPDYYFYDLNAKVTHTFSQKDKIYLNFYKGRDHIINKNESISYDASKILSENLNETSGWGNVVTSLRWNHTFGTTLFANTTIAYSHYDYFTTSKYQSINKDMVLNNVKKKTYSANYSSSISDLILKTDFDYSISNRQKLLFGIGYTVHIFNPGESQFKMIDEELSEKVDTAYSNKVVHANEMNLYIEDEITLGHIVLNPGVRFSGFISGGEAYYNGEPRLSFNYSLLPQLVFKLGYSRMVQYIHLLSTSGLTMPTDIWVPASNGLKPLKSDQITAGIAYDWSKTLLSLEIYQKWLNNTTDFKNGASLLTDASPWYNKTTQGIGNAKGIELSIEKQQGKFSGSLNYTLSISDRKYTDLNYGKSFPFRYQRLHDFNFSGSFQISKKWNVSAIWIYGTGYPVTLPVEQYSPLMGLVQNMVFYYPSINNYQLPDYHRLDISLQYKTLNHLGENSLRLDIFNAYNRKNVINMYSSGPYFKYSYLLPFIPTITYTLIFK